MPEHKTIDMTLAIVCEYRNEMAFQSAPHHLYAKMYMKYMVEKLIAMASLGLSANVLTEIWDALDVQSFVASSLMIRQVRWLFPASNISDIEWRYRSKVGWPRSKWSEKMTMWCDHRPNRPAMLIAPGDSLDWEDMVLEIIDEVRSGRVGNPRRRRLMKAGREILPPTDHKKWNVIKVIMSHARGSNLLAI